MMKAITSGKSPGKPARKRPCRRSRPASRALQRDIRQSGDDAGDRNGQRQPAIAEAAAHEVSRGDVVVLVADVPEPRKHQEQDRIDHNRVGHREERDGAGAERKCRYGDEGVGGVKVTTDQKPGDQRAEAPAAEAPFVQLVEVALAPMRGDEAQHGDDKNSSMKMVRAVQFSSCTTIFPIDFHLTSVTPGANAPHQAVGREIDNRGEDTRR